MSTAQNIGVQLDNFYFAWEQTKLPTTSPPAVELQRLTLCREFLSKLNDAIVEETKLWATDFQNALNSIDAATQAVAKAQATGALEVTISNADKLKGGWQLQIDNRPEMPQTGSTAAIKLPPGSYIVSASGTVDDKPVNVSHAVTIAAGQSTKVPFELK